MYLKAKYPYIQDLKLEYNTDKTTPHIYLALIRIKKAYRNNGYGSIVLNELIRYATDNNIEVWLYATNIYGSELQRLFAFYLKHGFIMTNKKEGRLKYKPQNVLQSV